MYCKQMLSALAHSLASSGLTRAWDDCYLRSEDSCSSLATCGHAVVHPLSGMPCGKVDPSGADDERVPLRIDGPDRMVSGFRCA